MPYTLIDGHKYPSATWATTLRRLGLPRSFKPDVSVGKMFQNVYTSEIMQALKRSDEPQAQLVYEMYRKLPIGCQTRLENPGGVDYILSAVSVDNCKIATVILEWVMKARSIETQATLALAAPDVAKAAIWYAGTPDGHSDRKMILQTLGVAPTPKSSVTNMTINNSKLTQVNASIQIPKLEDVTRAVESAQQKISSKEPPMLEGEIV